MFFILVLLACLEGFDGCPRVCAGSSKAYNDFQDGPWTADMMTNIVQ